MTLGLIIVIAILVAMALWNHGGRIYTIANRIVAIGLAAGAIWFVFSFHAAAPAAEQSRFYDSRGHSTGTAQTDSQGTTTFRDSRGSVTGKEYRR